MFFAIMKYILSVSDLISKYSDNNVLKICDKYLIYYSIFKNFIFLSFSMIVNF